MSLKAKIEAVIYASEDPVTLPQLVGVLGVEAQNELDALDARQGSLLPLGNDSSEPADNHNDGYSQEAWPPEARTSSEDAVASPEAAEAKAKRDARERERRLREYFRGLLEELTADYAAGDRGLEVREVAGGFRLATKPEFHETVRGFVRSLKPPLKLSLPALETLAVVAYKQPITAPEIAEIRGVDSAGVLGSLIARKLITTAGRKQVIGRPILYKTAKEFLLRFGLKDINELPSIEEFERMADELNDAVQEEMEMEQASERPASDRAIVSAEPGSVDSPPIDEINAAPQEPSPLQENVEDLLGDKGSAPDTASPETSPDQSAGAGTKANGAVEPMRDVHEAQADGVPEDSSTT